MPSGDFDYETHGHGYARVRRPDPRIAALIHDALGDARTVLNVGAGAGSYEPVDRDVTAVEPSASMRSQRPAHLSVAIDAVAEDLPFPDKHFDAAMGTFTIHQWPDLKAGLGEMRRVTRGPVLILTCDPDEVQSFWLNDYAPDVLSTEARRYPSMAAIRDGFATEIDILPVPIPLDCRDGFNEAYYGRPEMLLEDGARLSCSAWSFVTPEVAAGYIDRLRTEIEDGRWDEKYGQLRMQPEFEGSLYLIVSRG
jgi:SAM-dependent methyltransferase